MKALFLNCTLKPSPEPSHTEALLSGAMDILREGGAEVECLRPADFAISAAIAIDAGDGDAWPRIYAKVLEADIVILASPIWLGEKSSQAAKVIERLYSASSETNSKGQAVYYNKVGAAVVTGNEDGGKHVARDLLYALQHIGFTIAPNSDVYWVGEAGPGPSYMQAGRDNDFTHSALVRMSHNVLHIARMLARTPIPAEGNTL